MRVMVTQEHIDTGIQAKSARCPIAKAIADLGFANVHVGIVRANAGETRCWTLPKVAQQFIEQFDNGRPVSPLAFIMKSRKPGRN